VIWLLAGAATLFALMTGLRAFERANVKTVKSMFVWIAALAGLSLAVLLVLSGRVNIAIGALLLFGPLVWEKWKAAGGPAPRFRPRGGTMSRQEAYEVLGLQPGAAEGDIRDAHRRLMRGAHPDAGGSDWLAARINQARDVLLG
jgi:DnaJ-domain-containing protein 1